MTMTISENALAEAFPAAEAGIQPFGSRVLVQIRSPKQRTASGIITMASWPEGDWCKPGDFVRVAKYGGDRWETAAANGDSALFVIFNDLDIIGSVVGDPLAVRAFI